MATAGTLIDLIQERIRMEGTVPHAEATAISMLSYAQQLINVQRQCLVGTSTAYTTARQLIYPLNTIVTSALDILEVAFEGKRLAQIPHVKLMRTSCGRDWFRAMGPDPQAWCQVGRSQLIIWPGCYTSRTLTVKHTTLCTTLSARADTLQLPDRELPARQTLTEAILLLRQRSIGEAASALKEIGGDQK